jgi:TolA-binding protein
MRGGRQDGMTMGSDEAQTEHTDYGSGAPVDTATTAPEAQAAPDASASGSAGDAETLLNEAGQLFNAGNFQAAIDKIKSVLDTTTDDAVWGRAAYGTVMCYDKLGKFSEAAQHMHLVVQHVAGRSWDTTQYVQQMQGYEASPPRSYDGPPLLY